MKKLLVSIMAMIMVSGVAKAQFPASNEVYAYVEAGENLNSAKQINLYCFKANEVRASVSTVGLVKSNYRKDPSLKCYSNSKSFYKYDGNNSTSVRTTYVDHYIANQYSSYWGNRGDFDTYLSFSKDRQSLIIWYSDNNSKKYYTRVNLSEFAPKSQNRDFLYE